MFVTAGHGKIGYAKRKVVPSVGNKNQTVFPFILHDELTNYDQAF